MKGLQLRGVALSGELAFAGDLRSPWVDRAAQTDGLPIGCGCNSNSLA